MCRSRPPAGDVRDGAGGCGDGPAQGMDDGDQGLQIRQQIQAGAAGQEREGQEILTCQVLHCCPFCVIIFDKDIIFDIAPARKGPPMPLQNFSVINHPARMRIFQALNGVELSINKLAHALPDIPKPSLYRHVHKMLDAGVLQIARVRYVNGIEERFYIAVKGLIDPTEVYKPGGLEQFADHVRLYGSAAAQDLARYVVERGEPDLNNILARDYTFYATEQEFIQARQTLYDLLESLQAAPPAEGRIKRRIFVMGHPLRAVLMKEGQNTNSE